MNSFMIGFIIGFVLVMLGALAIVSLLIYVLFKKSKKQSQNSQPQHSIEPTTEALRNKPKESTNLV